ncbi:MAG: alpha/beta hydrolase [Pseudomonadota bacterium]|nr:alpha/beta hydrolase [Pseudomonadota bacterium]
MSPWRKRLHRVAAVLVGAYLLAVGILASLERQMVFPAPTVSEGWLAKRAKAQGAEVIAPVAEDGTRLYGWTIAAPEPRGVVVWFGGNGGTVGAHPDMYGRMRDAGWSIVQVNYRGYPGSEGEPSEAGLRMDARAAWAVASAMSDRVWIYGKSLGGGVAVGLAADLSDAGHPPFALVVESSFSSLVQVARESVPWAPVGLFMRTRFDSVARAPEVRAPSLVLHGEADTLIGPWHAEALSRALPGATTLTFPGAGHNDALVTTERGWAALERLLGAAEAGASR